MAAGLNTDAENDDPLALFDTARGDVGDGHPAPARQFAVTAVAGQPVGLAVLPGAGAIDGGQRGRSHERSLVGSDAEAASFARSAQGVGAMPNTARDPHAPSASIPACASGQTAPSELVLAPGACRRIGPSPLVPWDALKLDTVNKRSQAAGCALRA